MGIDLSKDMQLASSAGEEDLKPLVYHKSSEVIAILINNKNLIGLTRNNVLPVNVRVRIEGEIGKKIPAMALSIKITLAKRAAAMC